MILQIDHMWSPDLNPPSGGLPEDLTQFDVFVQLQLSEPHIQGSAVFGLRVCCPSILAKSENGVFLTQTLVMERFSWEDVKNRIEKLLRHCTSSKTWEDSINILAPYLHHS